MLCLLRQLTHAPPIRSLCPRFASNSAQPNKIPRLLRKRVKELPPVELLRPCISASKCQRYDLTKALALLSKKDLNFKLMDEQEALWVEMAVPSPYAALNDKSPILTKADIFVLENGAIVGWGVNETDLVNQILPVFGPAELDSFMNVETEDMDYTEEESTDTLSGMVGDVIFVHGPSKDFRLCDKLAFSHGMARNTKLSAIEDDAEKIVDKVKVISSDMASGNSPKLNMRQLDILTGRILQLRGSLNLYSSITETPDFYWSQPDQEALYGLISKSLDVGPRIKILNNKLDYAADMVSILRDHTAERKSSRVEWMILLLILVEVIIELKKTIPDWLETNDNGK